jgi:hypothetical protein
MLSATLHLENLLQLGNIDFRKTNETERFIVSYQRAVKELPFITFTTLRVQHGFATVSRLVPGLENSCLYTTTGLD